MIKIITNTKDDNIKTMLWSLIHSNLDTKNIKIYSDEKYTNDIYFSSYFVIEPIKNFKKERGDKIVHIPDGIIVNGKLSDLAVGVHITYQIHPIILYMNPEMFCNMPSENYLEQLTYAHGVKVEQDDLPQNFLIDSKVFYGIIGYTREELYDGLYQSRI